MEFLVERFGFENLKQTLRDLGAGTDVNEAIAAHTEPMDKLEEDFAAFARERAEQFGPGLDWKKFKPINPGAGAASAADLAEKYPTNFWALTDHARRLVAEKKWEQAKAPLSKLVELYPGDTSADSASVLLARVHRELKESDAEREVLSRLAALEADATEVFLRLMELGEAARDWPAVAQNAERFLAVNPLLPQPYRHLAGANEELGKTDAAIQSYQKLLLLDPPNPAEVHFRLARLLRQAGDPAAKRHVLQALEEAPRFREAHRLLLEINRQSPAKESAPADAPLKQP